MEKDKETQANSLEVWGLGDDVELPAKADAPTAPRGGGVSRASGEGGSSRRGASRNEPPNSIPENSLTNKRLDRAAVDRLLEQAGFTTVDELDAEDYRLIRETKVLAIKKLRHRLKREKHAAPSLASIVQKLGQGEKDKLGAIHVKIGRPSDRAKSGVTLRARIGIATAPVAGTKVALEVVSSDDKNPLAEDA